VSFGGVVTGKSTIVKEKRKKKKESQIPRNEKKK